jgi:hypothetical protein
VIRSIAELETIDPDKYKGKIGVVLVADGFLPISRDFLLKAEMCGLMDLKKLVEKSKI